MCRSFRGWGAGGAVLGPVQTVTMIFFRTVKRANFRFTLPAKAIGRMFVFRKFVFYAPRLRDDRNSIPDVGGSTEKRAIIFFVFIKTNLGTFHRSTIEYVRYDGVSGFYNFAKHTTYPRIKPSPNIVYTTPMYRRDGASA